MWLNHIVHNLGRAVGGVERCLHPPKHFSPCARHCSKSQQYSAGLEPVLSNSQKAYIVSYYRQQNFVFNKKQNKIMKNETKWKILWLADSNILICYRQTIILLLKKILIPSVYQQRRYFFLNLCHYLLFILWNIALFSLIFVLILFLLEFCFQF